VRAIFAGSQSAINIARRIVITCTHESKLYVCMKVCVRDTLKHVRECVQYIHCGYYVYILYVYIYILFMCHIYIYIYIVLMYEYVCTHVCVHNNKVHYSLKYTHHIKSTHVNKYKYAKYTHLRRLRERQHKRRSFRVQFGMTASLRRRTSST
jgi:hypothetical protein